MNPVAVKVAERLRSKAELAAEMAEALLAGLPSTHPARRLAFGHARKVRQALWIADTLLGSVQRRLAEERKVGRARGAFPRSTKKAKRKRR